MELDSAMPQLYKLFSLVATIGATSAGVERSFSCLKRLKSYTRNTMGQGRLSNLALLAIERTLVKSLEKTPSCNIVSAQIRPTSGLCVIHIYQMWGRSGPHYVAVRDYSKCK
ncbi:Zinc finger MYM-type protein 1 [Anabarilius grahami]|uniref:Zinc finger MYM-type protein 1 n=1 Tax=Anabarilius grahami TaxID=495550 RepID=A0A3N0Z5A1_ANAGA|nr:Zinc finger MYM-type protein 1 [Anabarilius grahami]